MLEATGTLLVEEGGSTVSGVFAAMDADDSHPSGWAAQAMIRTSRDCGQTWNEGIFLPREWNASEGALARAPDGALVVSLRTDRAPGLPDFCDHWRRLATARSVDNGLTWTDYQVHFDFGKVGITSRLREQPVWERPRAQRWTAGAQRAGGAARR